jgi:crotonobetainyl-CoA:carnitine CoA-transferase CaiB-like acyl-CoA transferase
MFANTFICPVISRSHQISLWMSCFPKSFYSTGRVAGPLAGYKVLDLGQVVAGNFCGALLAYFGADVIKVEPPNRGDALRHLRDLDETGTSLWWRSYGRNRKCITVDLHKEEGRSIIQSLARKVDVLVENFRPGVMEKWGLGPNDLPESLIYTRISGYGQTGPKANLPGYASVCEAYGGFRYINGYPDRAPVRPNISLGDSLAGLHAAFGTVMALLQRDGPHQSHIADGKGQVVDAAISESLYNMLEGCVPEYHASGAIRSPSGSTLTGVVPSGCWKAKDRVYIIIGGNGNSVYNRLMHAIGRPDMGIENPDFATDAKRCAREEEICNEIASWVASHTSADIMSVLNEARVPAGPILSIEDIIKEPQYKERGMFETANVPNSGESEYLNGELV